MDEKLTITADDVRGTAGSGSRLGRGATLSRADMLHLALMSSENRAAHVLCRTYPRGQAACVKAMNARARALGSQVLAHVEGGPCEALEPAALDDEQRAIRRLVHDTIAKVGDDVSRRYTFNTAIAAIMELSNRLAKFNRGDPQSRAVAREAWLAIVRMLAPITPHICEELWAELEGAGPLYLAAWPSVDESARERLQVTVVVQVNGKLRARLELEPGAPQETALERALAIDNVRRHLEGGCFDPGGRQPADDRNGLSHFDGGG